MPMTLAGQRCCQMSPSGPPLLTGDSQLVTHSGLSRTTGIGQSDRELYLVPEDSGDKLRRSHQCRKCSSIFARCTVFKYTFDAC
jgi:hypothetical protein